MLDIHKYSYLELELDIHKSTLIVFSMHYEKLKPIMVTQGEY